MAFRKEEKKNNLDNNNLFFFWFRIVGFDDLGGTDSFSTAVLELKLTNSGKIIMDSFLFTRRMICSYEIVFIKFCYCLIYVGVLKKIEENTPQVKGSIFQSHTNESDDDYD